MMKFVIVSMAILFLLSGCVRSPWVLSAGKYAPESQDFEVELPAGWRHNNLFQDKDSTIVRALTRDGYLLQFIRINKMPLDKEFPNTKKKLSPEMLPQEAAEVVFDDIRSNVNTNNQQMIQQGPTKFGDRLGFRLFYSYQTTAGLKMQGVCYGLLVNTLYYSLIYEAPSRYYFARDLPTFETMKDSFRILAKTHS